MMKARSGVGVREATLFSTQAETGPEGRITMSGRFQWFHQIMGETTGPVSSLRLRRLTQEGIITADTLVRKGADGQWVLADRIKGVFAPLTREEAEAESAESGEAERAIAHFAAAQAAEVEQRAVERWRLESERERRIVLSSGDIRADYEIIDLVFAYGNTSEGFLEGVNPVEAYQRVSQHLREVAAKIGADAVVNIRFDFRVALSQGLFLPGQVFEVYAYGTAVKMRGDSNDVSDKDDFDWTA